MTTLWQSSASVELLHKRAAILAKIRAFFAAHNVLEVDTPVMCSTSVTDPFIQSIPVLCQVHSPNQSQYYLQTSPEYAMKRLLASGSGDIYQISKAFRQGEQGRLHNPEFTMLEWYRIGFNHHDLMDEVDDLLQQTLMMPKAERKSYATVFQTYLHIDPHTADLATLAKCARDHHILVESHIDDKDTWLHLLMTHCIEPQLGHDKPCFIYDYPTSQAALARVQPGNPSTAARFEVYVKGIELANGFHELQDVHEQRQRFETNQIERQKLGLPFLPIDEYFLAALHHGLPDCSGVALGIDRLIMLATHMTSIKEVLSFDFARV